MTIKEAINILKRERSWRGADHWNEEAYPPTYYEFREALGVMLDWYEAGRDDLK